MTSTNDLIKLTAVEMTRQLASREVGSVDLVRAHLERIDSVDGRVRAFTDVFRERAMIAAKRADEERSRGEIRGALHGLPVSVKESLDMTGLPTTMGVPARSTHRAGHDAAMVQMLHEQGAVILGRTNLSQLMLFHESRNPLFGQTSNPFSAAHTPGGSSGGEAAAIAAGMSPLGVGTDIGGSIRVPAHFCGIAGLKPTLDRWSTLGCVGSLPGQEAVRAQVGPMARNVADLAMFMRAMDPARMHQIDPRVPPLPWTDPSTIPVRTLRIGCYLDDGLLFPSRAIARGVERAAMALRSVGCDVIPFTPPDCESVIYTYLGLLSSDGGETVANLLGDGEVDISLRSMRTIAGLPDGVRRTAARVANLAGESRVARILQSLGAKPVTEYWRLTHALREWRIKLLEALDEAALDVLICPASATPALPHTMSRDFVLAGSPAMLWNIVQFPAGVVPVTRVRPEENVRVSKRDRLEKRAAEVDALSVGLPIGVQVVARPWQDESVIAVMAAIEKEVSGDADFPHTPVM